MATRKTKTDNRPVLPGEREGATPRDYVYIGLAINNTNKKLSVLGVIGDNGEIERRFAVAYDRKRGSIIGGIYTGARFNDTAIIGQAHYSGKLWPDQQKILQWTTESRMFEDELASAKLEAETGRLDEYEKILAPIRKQYERARNGFDVSACAAIERAVMAAIRSKPRKYEGE